jgi:tetratricopeptide (TPR) repeat protein
LTLLARVRDLRVVSSNSTDKYAIAPAPPREIARDLNVTHVLQGNVQRSGDIVRINVRLIDAIADRHEWAKTYERTSSDVFALESDIAVAVARELQATLTSEERALLGSAPTSVPAAYDAYLKARAYAERSTRTEPEIRDAIAAYQEAVRLDPGFAVAWAQLSRRHSNLFSLSYDRSTERVDLARRALQEAMRIAPDRVETQLAHSYFLLRVERDFDAAEEIMRAVERRSPGNSEVAGGLAQLASERGRMQESLDRSRDSLNAEPQNPYLHAIICQGDSMAREFALAIKTCERALDLLPNDIGALVIEASVYQSLGQIDRAGAILATVRPAPSDWRTLRAVAYQAALTRQPSGAIDLLQAHLANPDALGVRRGAIRRWLADLQRLHGKDADAAASYALAQTDLRSELVKQPANPAVVAELALVAAEVGDGPAATQLARSCVGLASGGRALKEECTRASARVAMTTGDHDGALTLLRELLVATGGDPPLTTALLAIDPTWDPLRHEPGFSALMETGALPVR